MRPSQSQSLFVERSSKFRNRILLPSRSDLADQSLGYLTGCVVIACVALGGATKNGALGDVILQALAAVLLIAASHRIIALNSASSFKWPLLFIAATVLVPLIQLVPLPLAIWRMLPGRSLISETYTLIGEAQPASPITLTPDATWLSGLSLLPPIAVFLAVLTLSGTGRKRLSIVVITTGIASVFLGLLQLAGGPASGLRFYDITNKTEAVGFFANRNHFAALLYICIPFIAAHAFEAAGRREISSRNRINFNSISSLVLWLTALVIVVAGEMMARSRAGVTLTLLALVTSACIGTGNARLKKLPPRFERSAIAVTTAVLLFLLPLALTRILDHFALDPGASARIPFARNTFAAAISYMPLGSGLGSFVPVYQLFEKTQDIGLAYANHAHDDLLELWLETGLPGIILAGAFLTWLLRHSFSLWAPEIDSELGRDLSLRRAASIALMLLLAHSLVDYPLRTTTMMTVAAMATGFLIAPSRRHIATAAPR